MRKSDKGAEAALPLGVPRGRALDMTAEEQRLVAGGIGPGGQIGPDPETRRMQEDASHPDVPGHEDPIRHSDE